MCIDMFTNYCVPHCAPMILPAKEDATIEITKENVTNDTAHVSARIQKYLRPLLQMELGASINKVIMRK